MNKWKQAKEKRNANLDGRNAIADKAPDVEGLIKILAETPKHKTREERRAEELRRANAKKPEKPKVVLTDAQVWQLNHSPRTNGAQKTELEEFAGLRTIDGEIAVQMIGTISQEIVKDQDMGKLNRIIKRINELLEGDPRGLFVEGAIAALTQPKGTELYRLVQILESLAGKRIMGEEEIKLIHKAGQRFPINSVSGIAIRNSLTVFEREGTADEKKWVAKIRKETVTVSQAPVTRHNDHRDDEYRTYIEEERRKSEQRAKLRKGMRVLMREIGSQTGEKLTKVLEEYEKLLPDWSDRLDEEDRKHLGIIARDAKLASASENAQRILKGLKLDWNLQRQEPIAPTQSSRTGYNWDYDPRDY